jgi:hypothetical protein
VTIKAATTESRLAYQYTEALSFPNSNSLIALRTCFTFDLLQPELGQQPWRASRAKEGDAHTRCFSW